MWTAEQAVAELRQMAERKISKREDQLAYLLRTKRILEELSPADQFDLEQMYRSVIRPMGANK